VTPKEGKGGERGLSGSTNSLHHHSSPRALHTTMQRQQTNTQQRGRYQVHTRPGLEQIAPRPRRLLAVAIPRSSFPGPSATYFWPRGGLARWGTKPCNTALPPIRQPARRCTQLWSTISRFRTRPVESVVLSVPDELGLSPSQVTANSSSATRAPPLCLRALSCPFFFPRWALSGARTGPPPGSCFRQSLVG